MPGTAAHEEEETAPDVDDLIWQARKLVSEGFHPGLEALLTGLCDHLEDNIRERGWLEILAKRAALEARA